MKFFIDTEFSERGRDYPLKLISIGVVDENGNSFYAVSTECSAAHCNEWVRANVLPQVNAHKPFIGGAYEIAKQLRSWIGVEKPEFWGYYADYDWVALCQLFGTMMDLPKGWPMYCRDIKQLCDMLGNPKLPEHGGLEHHALEDARWTREAYLWLRQYAAAWPGALLP